MVRLSRLVSDKEEAEARAIQLALRKAFDEIDEDGGCAVGDALSIAVPLT